MQQQTMLIVTAHAADAVESAGGVIAKYAREGHRIHLLVLSNLDCPAQRSEIEEALRSLGITVVEFADRVGNALEPPNEDCEWLACRIRAIRPDFIITHAKEDLQVAAHRYICSSVTKAYSIASAAGAFCGGFPVSPRQTPMFGLPPDTPEEGGWIPGIFLDVTPFFEQKLALMDRLFSGDALRVRHCTERAKKMAVLCVKNGGVTGCQYAEAFSSFGPVYAYGHFVW